MNETLPHPFRVNRLLAEGPSMTRDFHQLAQEFCRDYAKAVYFSPAFRGAILRYIPYVEQLTKPKPGKQPYRLGSRPYDLVYLRSLYILLIGKRPSEGSDSTHTDHNDQCGALFQKLVSTYPEIEGNGNWLSILSHFRSISATRGVPTTEWQNLIHQINQTIAKKQKPDALMRHFINFFRMSDYYGKRTENALNGYAKSGDHAWLRYGDVA